MRRPYFALIMTGIFAVSFVSAARAADMPGPAPIRAPYQYRPSTEVIAPSFNWTGFYIGINGGYGWSKGSGTATVGGITQDFSGSGKGYFGGGQFGYNWQFNNFVIGFEDDFQGVGGSTTVTGTTFTGTAKNPWFATFRGRLGYAFDRTLIYATGGAVYGKSTFAGTDINTGDFSNSATYWTWTAGGGAEVMLLERWSAKVEYLYTGSPSNTPAPNGTSALSGNAHSNIIRAGLNYHF